MSEREPPEPSEASSPGEGPPSRPSEPDGPPSHLEDYDLDEVDVRDLLRAALRPPEEDDEKLRRRVQAQIREGSRGRFYADGWSTAKAPKETFLITSLLMLVVVVLTWALLGPIGFEIVTPP
jgi:hypothetical protein